MIKIEVTKRGKKLASSLGRMLKLAVRLGIIGAITLASIGVFQTSRMLSKELANIGFRLDAIELTLYDLSTRMQINGLLLKKDKNKEGKSELENIILRKEVK